MFFSTGVTGDTARVVAGPGTGWCDVCDSPQPLAAVVFGIQRSKGDFWWDVTDCRRRSPGTIPSRSGRTVAGPRCCVQVQEEPQQKRGTDRNGNNLRCHCSRNQDCHIDSIIADWNGCSLHQGRSSLSCWRRRCRSRRQPLVELPLMFEIFCGRAGIADECKRLGYRV